MEAWIEDQAGRGQVPSEADMSPGWGTKAARGRVSCGEAER